MADLKIRGKTPKIAWPFPFWPASDPTLFPAAVSGQSCPKSGHTSDFAFLQTGLAAHFAFLNAAGEVPVEQTVSDMKSRGLLVDSWTAGGDSGVSRDAKRGAMHRA
jgi:hypothetical protein